MNVPAPFMQGMERPKLNIVESTALTAAVQQHRKSNKYDLLTTYNILKMQKEDGKFGPRYARNTVLNLLRKYKSDAETSEYGLGKYAVYLYTNCLVFNIAYGKIDSLKTVEEIKDHAICRMFRIRRLITQAQNINSFIYILILFPNQL